MHLTWEVRSTLIPLIQAASPDETDDELVAQWNAHHPRNLVTTEYVHQMRGQYVRGRKPGDPTEQTIWNRALALRVRNVRMMGGRVTDEIVREWRGVETAER